jgi:uncharacterized protein (DUF2062 family)
MAMKRYFKSFHPHFASIRKHRHLQIFGDSLSNVNLWHLNRRSVSGAVALGLFCAFLPLPSQMVISAALAILLRVNLPISVIMVWITNPLTIPPMFYFAYRVGVRLLRWLGRPTPEIHWKFSVEWLTTTFDAIWQPLLLGTLVTGLVSALLGYLCVQWLWRRQVRRLWQARQSRRAQA